MELFTFSSTAIDAQSLQARLRNPSAGGFVAFEGWVRNHNDGHRVVKLQYEAFESLALKEGAAIVNATIESLGICHALCVHRVGELHIGEMAVWVGASAHHRDEAFAACRTIIDQIKLRLPIWKKEFYEDGHSGWVNCERCSTPAGHHDHDHGRGHRHHPHGKTSG